MKISAKEAFEKLKNANQQFIELFTHGSLALEIYAPKGRDLQQPHDRDEVYVIISGEGEFSVDDKAFPFTAGDFLFVPAGAPHRFERFSEDFATWVLFYGPAGGEMGQFGTID